MKKLGHWLIMGSLLASTPTLAKEYVLKLKSKQTLFQATHQIKKIKGLKVDDIYEEGQLIKVNIKGKNQQEIAEKLNALYGNNALEYAVENIQFKALDVPNDPKYPDQWHHKTLQSEKAWEITKGNSNIIVAVIDSGVDIEHEDLKGNIYTNQNELPGDGIDNDGNGLVDDIHGWDYFENDAIPNDVVSQNNPGHGTHVAGIITAVGNNQTGVVGVSQKVSILPIRFLGADGSGDLMNGVKAIDYAVQMGAQIINASWGATVSEKGAKPIIEAIQRAKDKGVLFVAAASNDGKSNDRLEVYPANTQLDNMISVAASNNTDAKPYWSNYGIKVHLAAPGDEILSTIPGNQYDSMSGTSMATPVVAGLSALLKSYNPALNPLEIRSLLQASGAPVKIETACKCRVDAFEALKRTSEHTLTLVPNTAVLKIGDQVQLNALGGVGPYTYEVSDATLASVSPSGELKALKNGQVVIKVVDANQQTAQSNGYYIGKKSQDKKGKCPFKDDWTCNFLCSINTSYEWCN